MGGVAIAAPRCTFLCVYVAQAGRGLVVSQARLGVDAAGGKPNNREADRMFTYTTQLWGHKLRLMIAVHHLQDLAADVMTCNFNVSCWNLPVLDGLA